MAPTLNYHRISEVSWYMSFVPAAQATEYQTITPYQSYVKVDHKVKIYDFL